MKPEELSIDQLSTTNKENTERLKVTLNYTKENWSTGNEMPVSLVFEGSNMQQIIEQVSAHMIDLEMDGGTEIAKNAKVSTSKGEVTFDQFMLGVEGSGENLDTLIKDETAKLEASVGELADSIDSLGGPDQVAEMLNTLPSSKWQLIVQEFKKLQAEQFPLVVPGALLGYFSGMLTGPNLLFGAPPTPETIVPFLTLPFWEAVGIGTAAGLVLSKVLPLIKAISAVVKAPKVEGVSLQS